MRTEWLESRKLRAGVVVGLLTASGVAVGFPWDVDMADNQAVKAYEQPMAATPPGSVAQPNLLTPRTQGYPIDRMSPEADALHSGMTVDDDVLASGKKLYTIYCMPCHGNGVTLGPVAQPGRLPGVIPLFGAVSTLPSRSDGYIYMTVKNGGAVMPSYGWAMNDEEVWSIVEWLRTQPKAARQSGG